MIFDVIKTPYTVEYVKNSEKENCPPYFTSIQQHNRKTKKMSKRVLRDITHKF